MFFFLWSVPAVTGNQTSHALSVPDSSANLVGLSRQDAIIFFSQRGRHAQKINGNLEDGGGAVGQESLDFRHADALGRENAVEGILDP